MAFFTQWNTRPVVKFYEAQEGEFMRTYFAIFDPSQPSTDGSYWSWRSPTLDRKLLDHLYYDFAVADRPQYPNEVDATSIIGGFVQVAPDWVFAYRFGNGGRDAHGRPGRFVMMVAATRSEDLANQDLSALLMCDPVTEALAKAPTSCPVPPPDALEVEIPTQAGLAHPASLQTVMTNGRLELSGPSAMQRAAAVCASLPSDRAWSCRIQLDERTQLATVDCPRPAKSVESQLPVSTIDDAPQLASRNPQSAGLVSQSSILPRSWIPPMKYLIVAGVLALVVLLAGAWWMHPQVKDVPGATEQVTPTPAVPIPPTHVDSSGEGKQSTPEEPDKQSSTKTQTPASSNTPGGQPASVEPNKSTK
ncbi:MAG: hypothetical protein ACYC26_04290 [Phycisphaerales bacterium]